MEPMYLKEVEGKRPEGGFAEMVERMKAQGMPVPHSGR